MKSIILWFNILYYVAYHVIISFIRYQQNYNNSCKNYTSTFTIPILNSIDCGNLVLRKIEIKKKEETN